MPKRAGHCLAAGFVTKEIKRWKKKMKVITYSQKENIRVTTNFTDKGLQTNVEINVICTTLTT